MIRVVIADDEPLVRQGLKEYLAGDPDVTIVGEAKDGLEAVDLLRERKPDLVFLDVQMPGLDGFEVLAQLGEEDLPVVVFVTAHDAYALRAFDAKAVDYLLKPFDRERFRQALDRARRWLGRGGEASAVVRDLLAKVQGERRPGRFVVRHRDRIRLIPDAEIDWIEARGNYVHLHHRDRGDGPFLLRGTLGGIERLVDKNAFVRVHRSALVRLDSITELVRLPGGDHRVLLRSGAELTLSRSHRAQFEAALGRPL